MGSPAFSIRNAPNVFIETVKRGDDDDFGQGGKSEGKGATSIVFRIYEALGGHAKAFLRISDAFSVSKAYSCNLLEDHLEELEILPAENGDCGDVEMQLDFRGFEVKTIKLVLVHRDEIAKEKRYVRLGAISRHSSLLHI